MTVHDLPVINAILNGTSGVLLVAAYIAIQRVHIRLHATLMLSAVVTSTAFLTCYLIYHFNVPAKSVGLPDGLFRTSYLAMLFSHVVLAVGMLPMIATTLWRAARRDWIRHRRIARPTFWIWLYVSVTGVVIYVILYHVVPTIYPPG